MTMQLSNINNEGGEWR